VQWTWSAGDEHKKVAAVLRVNEYASVMAISMRDSIVVAIFWLETDSIFILVNTRPSNEVFLITQT